MFNMIYFRVTQFVVFFINNYGIYFILLLNSCLMVDIYIYIDIETKFKTFIIVCFINHLITFLTCNFY